MLLGLGELRAGARTGHHVVGLLRHRARDLRAQPLGHRLGLVARHLLQRAGEHHGLAGDRRVRLHRLHRLDFDFVEQRVERVDVARLLEELDHRLGHHLADALDRVQIL